MRKLFFVLPFLLFSTSAEAVNCAKHPIFCKIKKLQPAMSKDRAMKLSNLIYKGAKKHGTDPMVSIAILNQESSFIDQHTFTIERDVKSSCNKNSCKEIVTEIHTVRDMTIAQINVYTAAEYGFDLDRLFSKDTEYALECHFKILESKIKMCSHLGSEAWSCYHSVTPKHRLKYVKDVSRYL